VRRLARHAPSQLAYLCLARASTSEALDPAFRSFAERVPAIESGESRPPSGVGEKIGEDR
jgi:hypothetical protein